MGPRSAQTVAVLRAVAARSDPTVALPLSAIAAAVGTGLSAASRLCTELVYAGAIERGDGYGSFRIGARALELSGGSARALGVVPAFELHRIAQDSAETVLLGAPDDEAVRVVAAVGSGWTLHVPATVGELIADPRRAVVAALAGEGPDVVESAVGRAVEIAVAVSAPDGRRVAVLAVSLPVYRAVRARPRVRRLLTDARRALERTIAEAYRRPVVTTSPSAASGRENAPRTVEAVLRVLEAVGARPATASSVAAAAHLRPERARRLVEALVRCGALARDAETDTLHLDLAVHGWHRAAMAPLLTRAGSALAPVTAERVRACVFVTTLRGMRSFTLVEHIEPLGEGLLMAPWLGRPHPLVGSDGGPTLAMDFSPAQLADLFPRRHGALEYERFVARVAQAQRDGVLVMESPDEFGITSVSAPVRDASGLVVAAACIVGATEDVRPRLDELRHAARALATQLSDALHAPGAAPIAPGPTMESAPISSAR